MRSVEVEGDRIMREVDRLQMALLPVDKRLIVFIGIPPGTWVCLPAGWRQICTVNANPDPRLELMPGPAEWSGEIAVHPALARRILTAGG